MAFQVNEEAAVNWVVQKKRKESWNACIIVQCSMLRRKCFPDHQNTIQNKNNK